MKLSAAAKVGLVTLVGLVLMVFSLGWLTEASLTPRGYRLKAVFSDVSGLLPGANVLLMGVRVGRVLSVLPQDRTVTVDLEIRDRATRILTGSHFKILNKGLIGEKNLEIFPPDRDTAGAQPLSPGTVIVGDTPPRLEAAFEQADRAIRSLRQLAEAPETKLALKGGLADFQRSLHEVADLIGHTNQVAMEAQDLVHGANGVTQALSPSDVSTIVRDLRILSSGLRQNYQALSSQGDQVADAKATLANIRSLTASLEGIATQVARFTADPKIKSDLKDLITSSRRMVNQVGGVADRVPALSPRFDLMGIQEADRFYFGGNFNMGLHMGNDLFLGGIEQIGEQNLWNISWGKPTFFSPNLGFHLGMIRSKIGAGLDWSPNDNLDMTGELFSPLTPTLRVQLAYYPSWWNLKYGLTGAWIRELNDVGNDRLFLGVQWRPLD